MQILMEWKHGVIYKVKWCHRKTEELSWPAQQDPEIQSGQPESSRLRDEREEEGREDLEEVRKRRATGKPFVAKVVTKLLCCTYAFTVNPQDSPVWWVLPIFAPKGLHSARGKIKTQIQVGQFQIYMWTYISNIHSTILIKFFSFILSYDLVLH